MKNYLLIAIVLLSAGESNGQHIRLGIKAGAHNNIFKVITKGQFDDSNVFTSLGIQAGFLADIPVSSRFSLQPQLLYVSKGGVNENESGFRFNTIDLSLNCNWRYRDFFIGLGPNFSYSIKGRVLDNGKAIDLYSDATAMHLVKAERFEIGANIRMGYCFPGGLMLEANYTPGFNNIFSAVSAQSPTVEAHNSFFGLSVGYILQQKKK